MSKTPKKIENQHMPTSIMKEPKIVFMGTSEYAVATLGALLMNGKNVVAVVTAPDKPAGRGRKLSISPVKEFALFSSLPVLQPENLKDGEFIDTLKEIKADLFIVVAFRMLPSVVWKMPPLGTINLHASLLPHYRGAAPINWAIINGETKTGNTTFFIDEKIDTGNILLSEGLDIFPFECFSELHDRLMKQGALLMVKTINMLIDGSLEQKPQSHLLGSSEQIKLAPKIFPGDCDIKWGEPAEKINNFIRGLSLKPGAKTTLTDGTKNLNLKILESHPEIVQHNLVAGTIVSDSKQHIKIACKNGFIDVLSLQLEGKKLMTATEFLRGFNILPYRAQSTQP